MEHANPMLTGNSNPHRFITIGEIMLRLTPPNYEKIRMASSFEASYGGSEANIALALANLGIDSTFFTVVPDNSLGKSAVRMLRSTIFSELQKDYVRTAISRGNDRAGVLRRHVLKNALAPIAAFLAQTLAEIVAGSIVVEQVFSIPGLGRILVASISNRDYPTVQAIVVILAFWVVLAGMLADLVSQWIDPRLRLGGNA